MCVATTFDMVEFAGKLCEALGNHNSPDNPDLLKFLIAWGREEGGGKLNTGEWYQSNVCTYNMLNMADHPANPTSGTVGVVGTCNTLSSGFGVVCFDTLADAVSSTANRLNSGYPAIAAAIAANRAAPFAMPHGNISAMDTSINQELQIWVSGSPNGNPGYPAKILSIAQGTSVGGTTVIDRGQSNQPSNQGLQPIVLAKGAIGFTLMIVGLALMVKALTPSGVQNAVKTAAKVAVL